MDLARFSLWKFSTRRCVIGLLAAATVWGFVDVRRRGYPTLPAEHRTDLTVYTEAGAAFFDGRAPYKVANPRGWTYLYPPLLAMLLAPLHSLAEQNQVIVWFFVSLLFCWGCWYECGRLLDVVRRSDAAVAAAWARWRIRLGTAAVLTALLPTLNCLQRGQVGILKLYLLLLGVRLILSGRSWRSWTVGGVVLALPITMKVIPALPVGFFLFVQLFDALRSAKGGVKTARKIVNFDTASAIRRRCTLSSAGVVVGLGLFFFLVPAMLVGWKANLGYLNTWGRFVLTKADNGGMDPRSGNSHTSRNQSLQNASYRLGNFVAHLVAGGPDDRLVENFDAPRMAMDAPAALRLVFLMRAALLLGLLAVGAQLARGHGDRLDLAVGLALGCVAMLVVSPVARGHYFMLLAPAVLFVPLWLIRQGRTTAATAMASVLPPLCLMHYLLLPWAGRIGLLGLGTTAWFVASLVVVARTSTSPAAITEAEMSAASVEPVVRHAA